MKERLAAISNHRTMAKSGKLTEEPLRRIRQAAVSDAHTLGSNYSTGELSDLSVFA